MSTRNFGLFKRAVAGQFALLSQHELFITNTSGDAMWSTYLAAFPPGTNEIHRKRAEYDCSCCRTFIKRVGNVVALIDGELVSIWDVTTGDPVFDIVAKSMSDLVHQGQIENRFLTHERTAGTDKNFEQLTTGVQTWEHFFVNIPASAICPKHSIGEKQGEIKASHDVLLRSLTELSKDSVDTVLELISQGSLYRGNEHERTVKAFSDLKGRFDQLPDGESSDWFVWSQLGSVAPAVARIRNTSIGTLLIDLSEGLELDDAVRKFEAVVAPSNYKRPKALVTQKMVDAAKQTIEELGLTSALSRRFASIDDLPVSETLFVDRSATIRSGASDAFGGVANKGPSKQTFDKVESIGIEDFIQKIIPSTRTLEVFFEGPQIGNLVSLVTASDPTAKGLFKWSNPMSWAYNGDLADSIKERVKKAGGNVEGDLCCRLAWFNHDDLDFHMVERNSNPRTNYEIYFSNKGRLSPNGGMLDVDMNAGIGHTNEPVENIFYASSKKMRDGLYDLIVHQYCYRQSTNPGFEVEIDLFGQVMQFSYPKILSNNQSILVAEIRVEDGKITIDPKLPATSATKEIWGLKTNQFHKVRALTLSPNYWGENDVGNKHYFFMLDQCRNDGDARGFFNEFLHSSLDKHRKVLEIVGGKMRTAQTPEQLSGLGFSSTKPTSVLARVGGSFSRVIRIEF